MESQGTSSARAIDRATKWIALGLTPGLGPTRSRRLVDHFEGAFGIAVVHRGDIGQIIVLLAWSVLEPGKSVMRPLPVHVDDRLA